MSSLLAFEETLLFDLLSTNRPVRAEQWASLQPDQCQTLIRMARQHRLESLLHCQIQGRDVQSILPAEIVDQWRDGYRRTAYKTLAGRRLLSTLTKLFGDAAIPFLALKGAWLAWHIYPDPAQRPMRDLDIMVSPDHLQAAFSLLLDNGFMQLSGHGVAFDSWLKTNKHLPELRCPHSGMIVEIHSRLFTSADPNKAPADLAWFESLYQRRIIIADSGYWPAYPSPTDSLLHVIVHAVDDHFFNNGPVFLTDVLHILRKGGIEWPRFWTMAEQAGWTTACMLVFDMVEYLHGKQIVDWPDQGRVRASAAVIEAALALCLQDRAERHNVALRSALAKAKGPVAKLTLLAKKLLPPAGKLAEIADLPPHSWRAAFYYPAWLLGNFRTLLNGAAGQRVGRNSIVPVSNWLNR